MKAGSKICFTTNSLATGFIISFDSECIEVDEKKSSELLNHAFFRHFLLSSLITVNEEMKPLMKNTASKMLEEFSRSERFTTQIIKALLRIFIIYTSRAIAACAMEDSDSEKTILVKKFLSQVEQHYATKKMVKTYAAMLDVSAGYLNETVRKISGSSASYHIQQRVMREAKRKILSQGSSMKEISYSLGFTDQAHFSKYFKKIVGQSFSDFKKDAAH